MRPVAKISEDRFKRSLPGRLQVRRTVQGVGGRERLLRDVVYDLDLGRSEPDTAARETALGRDLLLPVLQRGERRETARGVEVARERAAQCVSLLGWTERADGPREGVGPPAHDAELVIDPRVEANTTRLMARQSGGSRLSSEV